MQPKTERPQLTPLLTNEILSRLELVRINASRRFTNKRRGEHTAGREGTSTEFSDYRDYAPGDDIRFVDWNIFARLHRPYMKLYHQEEEMHVAILVDASASMGFEGKLERAKQLACAFGVMGLLGTERVGVYVFNARENAASRLRPCSGRASMRKLFAFLEGVSEGGDAPVEWGVDAFLRDHIGRGVAVLLSDFLSFGDLKRAFNLLYASGLEPFGIQILGPSEIDPDITGDVRFVDCETQRTLNVSATGDLLTLYREYLHAFEHNIRRLCRQRSGRFLSLSSEDPLEWVLFDVLRRGGWLR